MKEIKGDFCKDCKIFAETVDEESLKLIYNICNNKAFKNSKIRIMPDTHAGVGIVIGFTTPISDYVNPDHIGCDIGCCVDTYILDKPINPEEYTLIEHRIRKDVKFGKELQDKASFEMKDFIKFMKSEYSRAKQQWPDMIEDFNISEEGIRKFTQRIGMDLGVFYKSLGTIGAGNHFIEIGVTPDGNYAFTIHTGSRNLGIKVWAYWSRRAQKGEIDKKELKSRWKELRETTEDKTQLQRLCREVEEEMKANLSPTGYLEGADLKGYITDMVITQAYAKFNHYIIAQKISAIFKKINGARVIEEIRSTHNYIDMEDHIIRKGAIRSYNNEKIVIPFNMRDGLAICSGKSNEDWNYSSPHGSGRLMSRTKAKELLSIAEFQKQMDGIYTTSIGKGTIDESPMAYKETAEIVKLLEPSCEILYFIKPVISMKALNSMEE